MLKGYRATRLQFGKSLAS